MLALEKHIKPFYDAIKNTDINHIEVPDLDMDPIRKAYEKLYRIVAVDSAILERRLVKADNNITILKDEDLIVQDMILAEINTFLSTEAGATIVAIGNTSKAILQNLLKNITPEIIELGIGTGAAQTMLRDQIKSAWHKARYYRTERIVRTEVGKAANWGSITGVRSVGVKQDKHWVSAFSSNTRPGHAISQTVDLEEPFEVDGEQMDYPLDDSYGASAANIINCKCAVAYSNKGE